MPACQPPPPRRSTSSSTALSRRSQPHPASSACQALRSQPQHLSSSRRSRHRRRRPRPAEQPPATMLVRASSRLPVLLCAAASTGALAPAAAGCACFGSSGRAASEQQQQQQGPGARPTINEQAQEASKAFLTNSLNMEELWMSAVAGKLKIWSARQMQQLKVRGCAVRAFAVCACAVLRASVVEGLHSVFAGEPSTLACNRPCPHCLLLTACPLTACSQGTEQDIVSRVRNAYLDTLSRAAAGRVLSNRARTQLKQVCLAIATHNVLLQVAPVSDGWLHGRCMQGVCDPTALPQACMHAQATRRLNAAATAAATCCCLSPCLCCLRCCSGQGQGGGRAHCRQHGWAVRSFHAGGAQAQQLGQASAAAAQRHQPGCRHAPHHCQGMCAAPAAALVALQCTLQQHTCSSI